MSEIKENKNLIFLVGPTGSGKSRFKKKLMNTLNGTVNECISVDDFFEKDEIAKQIFSTFYRSYFNEDKDYRTKINANINTNEYLPRIMESISDNQINNRLTDLDNIRSDLEKLKTETEIPFSQFVSNIYFILRKNHLNKLFNQSICESLNNKSHTIIETTGENINSITGWFTGENKNEAIECDKIEELHLNETQYDITVYFLYRDQEDLKTAMENRFIENLTDFLSDNSNQEKKIPRLPDITENKITENIEKLCALFHDTNTKNFNVKVVNGDNDPITLSNAKTTITYKYCEKKSGGKIRHTRKKRSSHVNKTRRHRITWADILKKWESGSGITYPKQLKGRFQWNTTVLKNDGNVYYKQTFRTNARLPSIQDKSKFQEHINKATNTHVTSFLNPSKDTMLVIPMPVKGKNYATLRDFIDNAPVEQSKAFWKHVAKVSRKCMKKWKEVYITVHGLGVAYTHVRISSIPKYYFDKSLI